MLQGRFLYNMDEKNRLVMPPKFRDVLENATMTIGLDQCIAIYPEKEWNSFCDRLLNMDSSQEEARQNIRMFIGSAEDVEVDKQNRIKLPQALLMDVGIEKECMIVGVMNHIEIWPLSAWQAYKQMSLAKASSNAAKLGAGGF